MPAHRSRPLIASVALGLVLALSVLPSVPASGTHQGRLRMINGDGFGNPNNVGFTRLYAATPSNRSAPSDVNCLFTASRNFVEGTIVYRSCDGERFEPISPPGINGDPANDSPASLAWFEGAGDPRGSNGMLYVATWKSRTPYVAGSVFRANADAKNPSKIVWETITTDAFGDPDRVSIVGFATFKGHLYAGTFNDWVRRFPRDGGTEIFRTATGDPGDWTVVAPKGFGGPLGPRCNTDAHKMLVYGGYLYVGTEEAGCLDVVGGAIWRTDGNLSPPYDQWEQVNLPGFGRNYNNNVFGLDVFQGHMYATTWTWGPPGSEVWRAHLAPPGEPQPAPFDWEQVSLPGFGNPENQFSSGIVHLDDTLYTIGSD
ncbi:MAG: hypothetical protein ACRDJP_12690, partial [Actinomycetota bacterium]